MSVAKCKQFFVKTSKNDNYALVRQNLQNISISIFRPFSKSKVSTAEVLSNILINLNLLKYALVRQKIISAIFPWVFDNDIFVMSCPAKD